MVGEAGGDYSFQPAAMGGGAQPLATHPEIRDVLISGGDPLTLSDERLDYLLGRLRAIKHVEFVRSAPRFRSCRAGHARAHPRAQDIIRYG